MQTVVCEYFSCSTTGYPLLFTFNVTDFRNLMISIDRLKLMFF